MRSRRAPAQNHAMSLRALATPVDVAGRIWLAPMPGRLQPWPMFVAQAQAVGLHRIVCLTPRHEVASLSPDYARAITDGSLGIAWEELPMRDLGLAEQADRFARSLAALAERVRGGEVVLLHCAAGIGRTGTAAACLLKRLGVPTAQALLWVREAGSSPESAQQSGLIERF
jgi:Tyrosine phosphatase family